MSGAQMRGKLHKVKTKFVICKIRCALITLSRGGFWRKIVVIYCSFQKNV